LFYFWYIFIFFPYEGLLVWKSVEKFVKRRVRELFLFLLQKRMRERLMWRENKINIIFCIFN
jgi:hypothetical protein